MHAAPLPSATVALTRTLAVASTVALVALGLAWELWLAPTGRGTLVLKVLPLAFSLAGLLKLRLPTYRWVSLLVWLYVAEGALRASTEHGVSAALAGLQLVLCGVLFGACALHVRARLKAGRAVGA